MAAWLKSEGFQTHRVSHYWGNSHPAYKDTAMVHRAFYARIRGILRKMAEIPCEDGRCHEFLLHISGHGGPGTAPGKAADSIGKNNDWRIYRPDGSGEFSFSSYQGFFLQIQIPENVIVTIVAEICFSGGRVEAAQEAGLCNKSRNCGLTTIAASSSTRGTPSGHNSFRRRLMRADTVDQDNDGRKGDLWDRFAHLAEYQGDRDSTAGTGGNSILWTGPLMMPQALHCPDDGDWCSLDSGTP